MSSETSEQWVKSASKHNVVQITDSICFGSEQLQLIRGNPRASTGGEGDFWIHLRSWHRKKPNLLLVFTLSDCKVFIFIPKHIPHRTLLCLKLCHGEGELRKWKLGGWCWALKPRVQQQLLPCLGSLLRGIRTWHCAACFSPCHSPLPCCHVGKVQGSKGVVANPSWKFSSLCPLQQAQNLKQWMASTDWERDCWCSGHVGTK